MALSKQGSIYRLGQKVSRPEIWAIVWGSALTLGIVGSVISSRLGDHICWIPAAWTEGAIEHVIPNWLYALGVVILIVIVGTQRFYEASELKRNVESLEHGLTKVQEMNLTLPPASFGERLGGNYHSSLTATMVALRLAEDDADSVETKEDLQNTIRHLLAEIGGLTAVFDEDEQGYYHANVMIYVPEPKLSEGDRRALLDGKQLHFWCEQGLEGADGVLAIDRALTQKVRAGSPSQGIHPTAEADNLQPFALPVYRVGTNEEWRDRSLPGAPEAMLKSRMILIRSADDIFALADRTDVRGSTIEAMKRYFSPNGPGGTVRSFVSMPIFSKIRPKEKAPEVLGVLNIHSEREGMLRSRFSDNKELPPRARAHERYWHCMRPYIALLSELLDVYRPHFHVAEEGSGGESTGAAGAKL